MNVLVATVLALASAGLHAGWNLSVKTSDDRSLAAWGQFLFAGVLVLPVLVVVGWPGAEVVPFLVLSALVHVVYVAALVGAYDHGDFSLTYPVARGGGAFLAGLGGVVLLGDALGTWAWLAILIVALGLLSFARHGGRSKALAFACLTALAIATYTLIDAHGSRLSADGVSYGLALMPFAAITVSALFIARGRTRDFIAVIPSQWPRYLGAGVMLTVAYTLVLVAVRSAPVGYVAMLRESSIVFGSVAGWVLLHERLGRSRVISSVCVACGLVLLIAVG